MFVASGCEKKGGKKEPRVIGDSACGGVKQVDVTTTNGAGADPEIVYVCENDTVIWNANGHKFDVAFTGDSPFKDDGKKFDNNSPASAQSKHHDPHKYQLYQYRITVDGVQYDPQVLGGGKP
jgi:hypothetical protein